MSTLRQPLWSVAVLIVFALAVWGQQVKPIPDEKQPPDPKLVEKLDAAREQVKADDWDKALPALQSLLDSAEDALAKVERPGPDGKPVKVTAGVRDEASRLLDRMSAKLREEYQKTHGDHARDLFDRAVKGGDEVAVAEIARRFLHTEAGVEALEWLATREARRGDFAVAAVRFARLWQRIDPARATDPALFHSARTFLRSGDQDAFDRVWGVLTIRVGDGKFTIGGETRTMAQLTDHLRKEADQPQRPKPNPALFGGGPARAGSSDASAPFLEESWGPDTLHPHLNTISSRTTKTAITQALGAYETRGGIVIPAAFPIAAGGRLLYRSTGGLQAVDPKDGRYVWNNFDSARLSFDRVSSEGRYWGTVSQWCAGFTSLGRPNIIFENVTVGTLSADETRVYTIDDLPVPPVPALEGKPAPRFGALQEAVYGNRLQAYALTHGKLVWELGAKTDRKEDFSLSETHFLGAPLPLDGKLFVAVERQKQLQLLALDPERGTVMWHLPLITPGTPLINDAVRRTTAVHLAHAEGVLVVPTHAGSVLGIDLTARTLLWVHNHGMGHLSEWKPPGAVIHAGRVLVAERSSSDLMCLRLSDGALLWKQAKQDDDLYLAGVIGDKVLVVGKKGCRAVGLKNGKDVWSVPTGTPSGLGAVGGDFYYLPLKSGAMAGRPEICVIDAGKGRVQARITSRKNDVPGNLLFAEGLMLSQSLDRVAAYPLLAERLKNIDDLLKKNPKDPEGLLERGTIKVAQGDVLGAVEDLKTSLASEPPREVQRRASGLLVEAGLEVLRRDFEKGEKFLEDVTKAAVVELPDGLTPDEKEARRKEGRLRQTQLLLAVGAGREKQGKPVEAVKAYVEVGLLGDDDGLLPSPDDPALKVSRSSLAGGRVKALIEMARPEERKLIEEELERTWKEIREGTDTQKKTLFLRILGL